MPEEIYEQPRQALSQGDIPVGIPIVWPTQRRVTISKRDEATYAVVEPSEDRTVGSVSLTVANRKHSQAIVITHDCEIDKQHVRGVTVCPVTPLSQLTSKSQDLVRRNRVYSRLHLPAFRDVLTESFVDFDQLSTVDKTLAGECERIISLSDTGRQALYAQFVRWLTRWELREVMCPSCGITFNPTVNLPVRAD